MWKLQRSRTRKWTRNQGWRSQKSGIVRLSPNRLRHLPAKRGKRASFPLPSGLGTWLEYSVTRGRGPRLLHRNGAGAGRPFVASHLPCKPLWKVAASRRSTAASRARRTETPPNRSNSPRSSSAPAGGSRAQPGPPEAPQRPAESFARPARASMERQ